MDKETEQSRITNVDVPDFVERRSFTSFPKRRTAHQRARALIYISRFSEIMDARELFRNVFSDSFWRSEAEWYLLTLVT